MLFFMKPITHAINTSFAVNIVLNMFDENKNYNDVRSYVKGKKMNDIKVKLIPRGTNFPQSI